MKKRKEAGRSTTYYNNHHLNEKLLKCDIYIDNSVL